jgi:surface antigen
MRARLQAGLTCALLITSTACATKSGTGAAVGATGGGLIGAAFGGTTGLLIGAAAGGLLGYTAGREMEEEDRRQFAAALEADRAAAWTNSSTGYRYRVEPTRSVVEEGQPCREFRVNADVDGKSQQPVYGTACRQADGRWELVSG